MSDEKPKKLDILEIPEPCPMIWAEMDGDERKRFCGQCDKHVHNLSDMSKVEAEELLNESKDRLCVSFLRNDDGSIKTDECPKALRPLRNLWLKAASVAVGAMVAVYMGAPALAKRVQPLEPLKGKVVAPPERLTGDTAAPAQAAPPKQTIPQAGSSPEPMRSAGMVAFPVNPPAGAGEVIHCSAFGENLAIPATITGTTKGSPLSVRLVSPITVKYRKKTSLPESDQVALWSLWGKDFANAVAKCWVDANAANTVPRDIQATLIVKSNGHAAFAGIDKDYVLAHRLVPSTVTQASRAVEAICKQVDAKGKVPFPAGLSDADEVTIRIHFRGKVLL